MRKLTNNENVVYQLETLSTYEPTDIDHPEFEVAYEMPTGEEIFSSVCCVDLAKRSLKLIQELEEEIENLGCEMLDIQSMQD